MHPNEIVNRTLLAEFLGIPFNSINTYLTRIPLIADRSVDTRESLKYKKAWILKHSIPKRSKKLGFRVVYQVKQAALGFAHKSIYAQILKHHMPTEVVHGFVPGRNILTNAKPHIAKKSIICLDIKDFFESISISQVAEVFVSYGFPKDTSEDLARICTLDGHLVQGYVTSPMIANKVAMDLDQDFLRITSPINAEYTRYADDITISSDTELPPLMQIQEIVEKNGFALNKDKTRIMFRGEKQYVTGLTVFDNIQPRIPRRHKRKIRLILYYMKKYGSLSFQLKKLGYTREDYKTDLEKKGEVDFGIEGEKRTLKGWIDFINSIEPKLAASYYKDFNAIVK
jgi:RNA-directed DNA polymerase